MLYIKPRDEGVKPDPPSNGFVHLSPKDQRRVARLIVGAAYARRGIATLDFAVLHDWKNSQSVVASFAREDTDAAESWCLKMLQAGFYVAVIYKNRRGWSGSTPCARDGRYLRPVEYLRPYDHSEGCAIFCCAPCNCLAKLKKEKPPAWGEGLWLPVRNKTPRKGATRC
jgi:hypothetical protein